MGKQRSGGGGDTMAKLQKMIDESITNALGDRERREREESDPWARLDGIVERAVDRALSRRESSTEQRGRGKREAEPEEEEREERDDREQGGSILDGLFATGGRRR